MIAHHTRCYQRGLLTNLNISPECLSPQHEAYVEDRQVVLHVSLAPGHALSRNCERLALNKVAEAARSLALCRAAQAMVS